MYVTENPSKNKLKMRRASRRMSLFTADLRKLRLKEDVEAEDGKDEEQEMNDDEGNLEIPKRNRKSSVLFKELYHNS